MPCANSIGTAGACDGCCQNTTAGTLRGVFVEYYPLTPPITPPWVLVPQMTAYAAFINGLNFDTVALLPTSQVGINPGEVWILDYSSSQWSLYLSGFGIQSGVEFSLVNSPSLAAISADTTAYPFNISGYRFQFAPTSLSCWSLYEEVQYASGPNAPYAEFQCFSRGSGASVLDFQITPSMYIHSDDSPDPSVGADQWFNTNPSYYIGTNLCPPPPNVNQ
jgi:hypothetical protein